MKRQSIVLNPDPTDGPPEIKWSNCCICNIGGDLHSTDAGIESLAKQVVAWRKRGILFFENVIKANCEKYHHNC